MGVGHGDTSMTRRKAPSPSPATAASTHLLQLTADPRRAITEEAIICLVCGGTYRQLTNTHLHTHGMTTKSYKLRFGYNRGRPLMCLVLVRRYADRAASIGLASLIQRRPIVTDPDLRRRGPQRPITLEERLARQDAVRRRWPRDLTSDRRGDQNGATVSGAGTRAPH